MREELSRRDLCVRLLAGRLLGGAAAPGATTHEGESEKTIALVLFPELTLLDLVGPLQVLKSLPAPFRTIVVARTHASR